MAGRSLPEASALGQEGHPRARTAGPSLWACEQLVL